MAKTHFDFKKFTIYHDKCAMKVGTDGVLLGAWTEVCPDSKYILDIGTGSGLIAIMLAQKCNAYIIGIDIDEEAVNQATDNGKKTYETLPDEELAKRAQSNDSAAVFTNCRNASKF